MKAKSCGVLCLLVLFRAHQALSLVQVSSMMLRMPSRAVATSCSQLISGRHCRGTLRTGLLAASNGRVTQGGNSPPSEKAKNPAASNLPAGLRMILGAFVSIFSLLLLMGGSIDYRILFSMVAMAAVLAYASWVRAIIGGTRVSPNDLTVAPSNITGAGMGLFASRDFEEGVVLGTYPGRIWTKENWRRFKGVRFSDIFTLNAEERRAKKTLRQARAQEYVWLLEQQLIDPTDNRGLLCPVVPYFGSGLSLMPLVDTLLCRINEPPRKWARFTRKPNVETSLTPTGVQFTVTRSVAAGEEFLLDYGSEYNRSGYADPQGLLQSDMIIVPNWRPTGGGNGVRFNDNPGSKDRQSNSRFGPAESNEYDNTPRCIWLVKPEFIPEIDQSTRFVR